VEIQQIVLKLAYACEVKVMKDRDLRLLYFKSMTREESTSGQLYKNQIDCEPIKVIHPTLNEELNYICKKSNANQETKIRIKEFFPHTNRVEELEKKLHRS
jgi:hypothetical protein